MKKLLLSCLLVSIVCTSWSQKYQINWGDEIKLKKGTTDLDIVCADNTG